MCKCKTLCLICKKNLIIKNYQVLCNGCKYAESHQYENAVGWLRLASAINANADVYLLRILADNPHLCQEKTELEIISTYNESNRSYENKMRWLCRHKPV